MVTLVTLTGSLEDLIGADFVDGYAKVWLETNVPADGIFDATGNQLRLGDASALIADGAFEFTGLWATDSATNPTDFQYQLHVQYTRQRPLTAPGSGLTTWSSGWFSLTATSDIADVVAEQYVPPTWMNATIAELTTYVDAAAAGASEATTAATLAEFYADQAHDWSNLAELISGLTGEDGAVAALVTDPLSDLTAALKDNFQVKSSPLVVTPEMFGAVGDGVADDTVPVQAACDFVAALGGGTVLFGVGANYGKVYLCNGAPRTDRRGNSIIAMPHTGSGTIVLKGFGQAASGPWSWIKTTRTTDVFSPTYGAPSVVGGPTTQNSTGTTLDRFSYWNVVIDGLGMGLPTDPQLAAYDFRKMITAKFQNYTVFAPTPASAPTAPHAFGIGWPSSLNSGNMPGDSLNVFGMYAGAVISSPHTDIRSITTKYCYVGIALSDDVDATVGDAHASRIGYWGSENCKYHLAGWNETTGVQSNAGTTVTRLLIDLWDIEDGPGGNWWTTTSHLLDANNTVYGKANLARTVGGVGPTTSELTVSGGKNLDREYLGGSPRRSYTPALAGTGWSLGSGTAVGRFSKKGKDYTLVATLTFGAGATFGAGGLEIGLPTPRVSVSGLVETLVARMVDSSSGEVYTGTADIGNGASTALIRFPASGTNGKANSVISTAPFLFAVGDQVTITGTYEGP